jgi:LPS export ABC transporter protein LptC
VVPIDSATNVESLLSQDGVLRAKLSAPLMTMQQRADSPTTIFPKTLHVDFYDSTSKVQSKLFAKYGLYYNNQRLVFLKDSVIFFNMQGDTIRTNTLWWDQDKEIIYTKDSVHIRKPDEHLDGTGMTADQNFNHYTIFNAKGPVNVPDSTLPTN